MKNIIKGWSVFELSWLVIFALINVYLFFAFEDTTIGLIASLSGMLCVVLVAKGKISNYIFGVINLLTYSYISYNASLYGEVMLNMLFYLPIQFIGFYMWKKNQIKTEVETVVKAKRLKLKDWSWLIPVVILVGASYSFFLNAIGGQQAGVDSFAVILSITANILMVKRYAEQWLFWIVVNCLSIILWLNVFIQNGDNVTMLVMWSAYLVNSIYGYVKWVKLSKLEGEKCLKQ